MRTGCIAEIRVIENGFVVTAVDPDIKEKNKGPAMPYEDPEIEYSFPTFEAVVKWLKAHADVLVPPPDSEEEYASAFDSATATEKK